MKIFILCMIGISIISCSHNQQSIAPGSTDDNILISSKHIPYTLASNYFVRNDFKINKTIKPYIDSLKEFELIFGVATTMVDKSKPTSINFEEEIVIPIILDETNVGTTIKVKDIYLNGNTLKVRYVVKEFEPITYVIQPSEVIIIKRKYLKNLNQLKFEFEKIKEL